LHANGIAADAAAFGTPLNVLEGRGELRNDGSNDQLVSRRLKPFYSSRNVLAGSIFAIFRIGRIVASSVTNTRVKTTVAMVGTS
jgi:hypothetical protein